MTNIQVEYNKLLETKRANKAQEELRATQLHQEYMNILEGARHNKEVELNSARSIDESIRHATTSEQISLLQAHEAARHNLALEQVQASSVAETSRHNEASEILTSQYNTAQIEARKSELAESMRYHDQSIGVSYANISEVSRHNVATEVEINRSNVAHESELNRSDVAREKETASHDIAMEKQAKLNYYEDMRHNFTSESIEQQKADLKTWDTIIGGVSEAAKLAGATARVVGRILSGG